MGTVTYPKNGVMPGSTEPGTIRLQNSFLTAVTDKRSVYGCLKETEALGRIRRKQACFGMQKQVKIPTKRRYRLSHSVSYINILTKRGIYEGSGCRKESY